MSMTPTAAVLKRENLAEQLAQLTGFLDESFQQGRPMHDVERGIWKHLLQLGHQCLELFLALHGSGDLGETVTLPTGDQYPRLEELHARRYLSIFGVFELLRAVYGSR